MRKFESEAAGRQSVLIPVRVCMQDPNQVSGLRRCCPWCLTLNPPAPPPLSPAVVDLVYWRDVKTTGVVFGAGLLLLLSLTVCSIVSVCSYIGLALLSVTICFRIYKGILQAIQKSDEGHPFK
ncbi:reticulon-1-like [Etheostoma cragini]|uniref:reticulon-1-like n=1 Tax=Etheostoma cragini TaxID=417921 RepID=UPI00155F246A|nr:reticulon-1-like [Etheostoma cragini]